MLFRMWLLDYFIWRLSCGQVTLLLRHLIGSTLPTKKKKKRKKIYMPSFLVPLTAPMLYPSTSSWTLPYSKSNPTLISYFSYNWALMYKPKLIVPLHTLSQAVSFFYCTFSSHNPSTTQPPILSKLLLFLYHFLYPFSKLHNTDSLLADAAAIT